jgi:hypothetical protein
VGVHEGQGPANSEVRDSVEWLLAPNFVDPEPHTYQLQWGQTDSSIADDWEDVGLPADDVFTLEDTTPRAFGHVQRTFYRVKLTTPIGEYISRPQHSLGDLSPREWRLFLNRERIWRVQFERTIRGQTGFLLKRRVHGEKPTAAQKIIDWQTDEIVQAQAEEIFGADFIGGYYPAVCCDADLSNFKKGETLKERRGMTNDTLLKSQMLATPMADSGDIWVSATNDMRWRIWNIDHIEEFNGVPVVISCTLSLVPFSNVVYKIPIQ